MFSSVSFPCQARPFLLSVSAPFSSAFHITALLFVRNTACLACFSQKEKRHVQRDGSKETWQDEETDASSDAHVTCGLLPFSDSQLNRPELNEGFLVAYSNTPEMLVEYPKYVFHVGTVSPPLWLNYQKILIKRVAQRYSKAI